MTMAAWIFSTNYDFRLSEQFIDYADSVLNKGAVWMRTVSYFTKRSPASFFMEGKKAE